MRSELLFGKFQIIECFKKDDSLAVYLAVHIFLNKKIILKTLNTKTISDQVILERFKREARLLAQISHPNIISIYDFGTYEEFFYISFEYFEGRNLRQAFNSNSWTIEDKIDILNQIASGLFETHQKKVIHRDLKPENILINANNEVKIADFGLAQISGGEKLTAAEAIVGTPAYMTPEQIRGLNADERSDLFSLGILIYELFFGVNPFLGKDAGQTLNNIQQCRINTPPPHPGMPEYIPLIIDTLLKKNQSDRPASVDFIFKLTGKSNTAGSPATKNKRRYLLPAAIISGIIAVVFLSRYIYQPVIFEKVSDDLERDSIGVQKTVQDSQKLITPVVSSVKSKAGPTARQQPGSGEVTDTISAMPSIPRADLFGFIDINCKPWAKILIDSIIIDTTPIKEPLKISAGRHFLQLIHPEYPVYESSISVLENDTLRVNVNLDSIAGYLVCNVFPWGDIYINDILKGQTPLNRPIILPPGKHILEIKNPGYENFTSEIYIEKSDTLRMTLKLTAVVNSN